MSPIKSINGVESPDNLTSLNTVLADSINTVNGVELPEAVTASVITTNLIQHLDAADSSSYGGSGTTWTDLSGQGHHLTLIGSPTYTSTGSGSAGGEFTFDGVDESARINYADATDLRVSEDSGEVNRVGTTNTSTSDYDDIADDGGLTIQAWVKPLSFSGSPPNVNAKHEASLVFSNNGHITSAESNTTWMKYYQGVEFVVGRNSNLVLFYFAGNGGNASTSRRDVRTYDNLLSSTSNLGDFRDEWVNVAVTVNSTSTNDTTVHNGIKFYVQGQPVGSSYIRPWSDYNEGTGPGLGYRKKFTSSQSGDYHAGTALRRGVFARMTMSHLLQYNDILTDAEILQNYNATKSRHGY
jgi:hypothetical protein